MLGNAADEVGLTGCTVVLLPPGTIGAVEVRGGAPGTRETDLLKPGNLVETVDAFLLAGGSAFGLAAADGVMRWLEENGRGFAMAPGSPAVPIVPGAVIFDLGLGDATARPDAAMGYRACADASPDLDIAGNVGAGMGATVGKVLGHGNCMKGGLGVAFREMGGGVKMAAIAVVNGFGDVLDEQGDVLAGARAGEKLLDTRAFLESLPACGEAGQGGNTTIAAIVTNAVLSRPQAQRLAGAGQQGIARCVSPSHTRFDGDTVFAAATGELPANPDLLEVEASSLTAAAIRRAVREALPLPECPAAGALD